MPSVIVRRPKGVVGVCVCIVLHLLLGKRNLLAKTALNFRKLLTVILGNANLLVATLQRRASGIRFGGLFLLRLVLSNLI